MAVVSIILAVCEKMVREFFVQITNFTASHDSMDSSTHFLLTLASERYTIYFDIGRKPEHVCI